VDGCRGRSCERCCRADLSRVITLAANTGRRGSDLIRMCPTDIETFKSVEGINVVQRKTDRQVWVPITSPLARTMVAWERRRGPFLTHLDGRPWKRKALTMAWDRHREHNKDLGSLNERGLVLHGLRGTACVRLRQAGATIPQIADMGRNVSQDGGALLPILAAEGERNCRRLSA
jgi:integrase